MTQRHHRLFPVLGLLFAGLIACQSTDTGNSVNSEQQEAISVATSPQSTSAQTTSGRDLTQLFSRVWRVTAAPSAPAAGSIYIFLPNGTLLQTSCVETYAIFPWVINKETPNVLQVSENGELAYRAEILELTGVTLRLQKRLVRTNETQEVTLTAVEEEFICPDLPK